MRCVCACVCLRGQICNKQLKNLAFTFSLQQFVKKKRNVIVCNNNNRKPVSVCLKWNVFLLQEHVKDILADTVEKTIQTAC